MKPRLLRLAVPLGGLVCFAIMALVYNVDYPLYIEILTAIGIHPFRYPFLDWEYISAGAQCWKHGVNVYISDPCDVLGRPHGYSPLWLRATFLPSGPFWRNLFGFGFILGYIVSLYFVLRPKDWSEARVFGLASISTMVVFALERGNVDVPLFLVFVCACFLATGPLAARFGSYGIILFAGLLKFYPLAALSTALRERPRTFFAVAAISAAVVLVFLVAFRTEIVAMNVNIPSGAYMQDRIGALNLPSGLAAMIILQRPVVDLWQYSLPNGPRIAIGALLVTAACAWAAVVASNQSLTRALARITARDRAFLVLGAALICGCFFAGQSIGYRGIHLIFVVGGLVALAREIDQPSVQSQVQGLALLTVALMWEGLFRFAVSKMPDIARDVVWFAGEVLWWYLAASLMAILVTFAFNSETYLEVRRSAIGLVRRTTQVNYTRR